MKKDKPEAGEEQVGGVDKPVARIEDHSARRLKQLADENRLLRGQVADVMERLHANDRLFARLFDLETAVLAATDPEDLCFTLLRGLRSEFELDMARLWFERSGSMGHQSMDALSERDLVWIEGGEVHEMGLAEQRVCLLSLTPEKGFSWLETRDSQLCSMALLTLGDLARPFGVLGIGTVDPDRFHPSQASDFLQHLAQVVGLSLENSVVRERLARLSVTDSLTGSRNRRFLQPHNQQPVSQLFGKGVQVACLYVDIDAFKSINDRHGHSVGDDVLSGVVEVAGRQMRANDPIIRMGGDEFALLLPGCSLNKAQEIGQRIVSASAEMAQLGDDKIGVSLGVAFSSAETDMRLKSLIEVADRAMYVAKALGGNRLEVADQTS